MDSGKLYFIDDSFKYGLLENKATINGIEHNRPCRYLFKYEEDGDDIYWMFPISSQISKYKAQYSRSMNKYGMCDNISFGYILGNESAFLPQNLFPVTKSYIKNIYIDSNTSLPITIPKKLMAELNAKARKKIRFNQQGKPFGLSDTMAIYNELKKDLSAAGSQTQPKKTVHS